METTNQPTADGLPRRSRSETDDAVEQGELLAIAPESLLSVIAKAVTNPLVDVEKMERLFALYERNQKEQQRIAYQAAMARLQAQLPQIEKHGRIEVKGVLRSKFATIEDIDAAI